MLQDFKNLSTMNIDDIMYLSQTTMFLFLSN